MDLEIQVFRRIYGHPGEVRYEFSEADNLVGVASVFADETSYCLTFLNVMPNNRGQGYGSKILEALCQKLNDKPIILELDRTSPFGIDNLRVWYMRHGFVPTYEDWMIRQPKSGF